MVIDRQLYCRRACKRGGFCAGYSENMFSRKTLKMCKRCTIYDPTVADDGDYDEGDEELLRSTLCRWAAKDEPPPDGVYISYLSIDSSTVKIGGNWNGAKTLSIASAFELFGQLYGPIGIEPPEPPEVSE
jgi:hypothetical protein